MSRVLGLVLAGVLAVGVVVAVVASLSNRIGPRAQVTVQGVIGYVLDVQAYLALVARNARWTDLAGNTAYPAGKSILITSTDVRTSNSAAMYLSIASYVANGGNVVADDATARKLLPQVAPLFLRQGFSESSTDEPFEDYLSIGIGKTPMVMIYRQLGGPPPALARHLPQRVGEDLFPYDLPSGPQ